MKTLLISLTRGTSARNIMRTGVLKRLLEDEDLRIVVVIPTKIHDYFREEFSHTRIILEEVKDVKLSRARSWLIKIYSSLIFSITEYRHLKFGGMDKRPNSWLVFQLKNVFFRLIGKFRFLKVFARWTEKRIFKDRYYDYLFDEYKPDLLFCTTIYAKLDTMLIKSARRYGVVSVSLPKSWDTVGRQFFRIPANKLLVNNTYMLDKIVEEQMISDLDIEVVGSPQFDVYQNKKDFISKQDFCQQTGLDPNKPTVLFISEGKLVNWDEYYVDQLLANGLLDKYNLIVRPHFTNSQEKKYHAYKRKGIYVDDEHVRFTNMFHDYWDPTKADMDWQADVIKQSDVVLGFMSTFTLDAMINGKPVINIYYDPLESAKRFIPMKELYRFPHYEALLSKGGVPLAKNVGEMLSWIDRYIQDPALNSKERKAVLESFCYKLDGKAGERIAEYLLKHLN